MKVLIKLQSNYSKSYFNRYTSYYRSEISEIPVCLKINGLRKLPDQLLNFFSERSSEVIFCPIFTQIGSLESPDRVDASNIKFYMEIPKIVNSGLSHSCIPKCKNRFP